MPVVAFIGQHLPPSAGIACASLALPSRWAAIIVRNSPLQVFYSSCSLASIVARGRHRNVTAAQPTRRREEMRNDGAIRSRWHDGAGTIGGDMMGDISPPKEAP